MSTQTDSKDCVLFATADWDTPYWTNKQHTARHLARQGYRVLYIESIGLRAPTVSGRDLSRIWQRLKRGLRPPKLVEPGVWVMSPIAIPFKQHWPLMRSINQGWLSLRIKLFMLRQGFKSPLIWTYHPFMLGTIARLNHGPVVYHCVDDLSAIPGIDPAAFNAEEQRLLLQCQIVFVTSQTLKDKCQPFNANTYYFPNVADVEHFGRARATDALPADLADIPAPRIGYVGALSDYKIDFKLIHDLALEHPKWSWVLIGEEREGQHSPWMGKLRQLFNVYFLGHKSYDELPNYLRGIDVGTLPTLLNDYTRSMFPMKYFEYLAAGVPVVTTSLEFTKSHKDGLLIADGAPAFAAAIETQLKRGHFSADESDSYVGENTWDIRLKKMIALLADDKKPKLTDGGFSPFTSRFFGYLKPVLSGLILPPMGPLLLALFGLLLLLTRAPTGLAVACITIAFALIWLLSCHAIALWLSRTLLPQAVPLSPDSVANLPIAHGAQAIVVLGGGVELFVPEFGEVQLAANSAVRLRYAARLAQATGLPLGFAGGLGWAHIEANSPSEAAVARRTAMEDHGIVLKWVDDQSRDTKENAEHMAAQLGADQVKTIVLVTHAWHMPRAVFLFEAAGLGVIPAPTGFLSQQERTFLEWMPSGHGLGASRQVLREWLTLILTRRHIGVTS